MNVAVGRLDGQDRLKGDGEPVALDQQLKLAVQSAPNHNAC
jgi:hypothetical protein